MTWDGRAARVAWRQPGGGASPVSADLARVHYTIIGRAER
jgi:hypothetical protein